MASAPPQKFTSKLHKASVLIIGGTSGIGYAIAEACLEFHCARLTIAGSRQSSVDQAISRLRASYPASSYPTALSGQGCDLADIDAAEANLKSLLAFATGDGVQLDHVVNTAGDVFSTPPLAEITPQSLSKGGAVRFFASVMLAKLLSPATDPEARFMRVAPGSSLTLTGGAMATRPQPNWTTSVPWTAAKEGMTRGLAVDLAPIRVNCVAPGVIRTEFFDKLSGGDGGRKDSILEAFRQQTLLKTLGTPEDVAEAYLWLMRDSFATGNVVHCNGGYFLS